jgi:heat shock protein HtpX
MASLTTLKINSYIFMGLMVLIFAMFIGVIGFFVGIPYYGMIAIFIIILVIYIAISSSIVKLTTGTKLLKPGEMPYLEEKVDKLCKKAGIPTPKLGIVEDMTPNAFVFGLTQSGSTLSVHRGLLHALNDEEIEAVLGHEIGHIKNRDCMYMTFLSVIPLITYFGMRLLFIMRYGGSRRDGKAMAIILAIGLLSAIVYFLTNLLIKRLSRIREFYADAYSAHITQNPHALSSALTKITYGLSLAPPKDKAKNAARSFYIGDVQNAHTEMDRIMSNASKYDLDGDGVIDENELELAMADEANRGAWEKWGGFFRTHPPTFKRILALNDLEKDMTSGEIRSDNIYEKVEF